MKPLKQVLFEKYGGFADKRIRNLNKSNIFIADDRAPGDVGADHQLLSYFCTIFINTQLSTQPRVELRGNVPTSAAVKSWVKKNGAVFCEGDQQSLEFEVSQGHQEILRSLAAAIRSIVAPGAPRYSVPSYKYVCPRTADSLERLAETLEVAWSE